MNKITGLNFKLARWVQLVFDNCTQQAKLVKLSFFLNYQLKEVMKWSNSSFRKHLFIALFFHSRLLFKIFCKKSDCKNLKGQESRGVFYEKSVRNALAILFRFYLLLNYA